MMMMLSAALSALAQPNTCQPRAAHPFLPIYHIIGNVSSAPDGQVTAVEDINDVSSVIEHGGIYHVFHQCCQNHWDHGKLHLRGIDACSLLAHSLPACRAHPTFHIPHSGEQRPDPLDPAAARHCSEHEPDRRRA